MKRIFLSLMLLTALAFPVQAQQTVKVSQNGLETTMSNGIISLTIGTNGRINTLTVDGSENLIGSTGIYFDHTRKGIGNKPLSPSKAEIISHTDDYAEVLYTNTSYHPQFKQGFILRRGVSGIYTYILGYGDSQSGDIQVQEMRVCTRLNENFLNGYVDDRMQGRLPASAVIAACEADGKNNPAYVQDATYRLDDGTVYTKYDWAQLCVRDSLHGLMSDGIGVWNIPCSYEWMPGGPTKQELTVHATKVSPITIQMLQGEHFGTSALVLDEGDSKIWGPVFIYINKGTREEMIADAKREAHEQQQAWPFDWFKNALYPLDCSTVTGRINVTTGQRCDSIQVVLAQPDAHLFDQNKGYLFWALTDSEGRFSIPKVRRGTYALRAYATAGDVTDELQVRDINVDTDLTDLGTIEWRPDCYETQLWRIGKSDRLCEEFRLGEGLRAYGLWKQVPADLTYWPDTKVPGTEQKKLVVCPDAEGYLDCRLRLRPDIYRRRAFHRSGSRSLPHPHRYRCRQRNDGSHLEIPLQRRGHLPFLPCGGTIQPANLHLPRLAAQGGTEQTHAFLLGRRRQRCDVGLPQTRGRRCNHRQHHINPGRIRTPGNLL